MKKFMTRGLKNLAPSYLSTGFKKQITFPKNTISGYLFRYGSGFISIAILALTAYFLLEPSEKTLFYLLALLIVLISTLLGGSIVGFLVTTAGIIIAFISIYELSLDFFQAGEIFFYAIIGLLFGYILDMLRQVKLVKEFNRKETLLQKKLHELEENMTKAQTEIRMRDEFLSIASHELKTPLASTLLQIQIALHNIRHVSLAKFSVQDLLHMLETVEQQTQRLSKMIKDLLNVSLITTGKITIEPSRTSLTEIVRDTVEKVPYGMNKPDYPISFTSEKDIIGNWDKIRLEQAISNLISNAIKYGNEKPVEVTLSNSRSSAKLIIKDHGIGIPKQEQKVVFERFERGHNSSKQRGLGVGLYITKQIIKAHHGKIDVESKEGKGSTFSVELPVKK